MALNAELFGSIKSQGKLKGAAHQVVAGNTGNIPL
jgi:hypothetical protein